MIKIELTKEELQTLSDRVEQAINDEIGVGDTLEIADLDIEIVCSDCHGTGVVTEGQHDDIRESKCACQIEQ